MALEDTDHGSRRGDRFFAVERHTYGKADAQVNRLHFHFGKNPTQRGKHRLFDKKDLGGALEQWRSATLDKLMRLDQ